MQPDHRAGLADRQAEQVPATWLPSEVGSSSLSITLIGTSARSVRLPCTDSARVISQLRIAPVTVARMTSLTVPPWNRRTVR